MLPDDASPTEWLRFAQSDLDTALGPPKGRILLETLCFHAQQAVEKSLKAILAVRGVEFPRTHNLRILMNLLPPDLSLPADPICIGKLTDYAVSSRYPGVEEPVTEQEYHEAVRLAESVVKWAEDLIGV